jgi:hypothetical protein
LWFLLKAEVSSGGATLDSLLSPLILNSKPKTVVGVTDVRTQGMYQLLDPGFVGLIFSCFSEDAGKVQTNT